MRGECVGVGAFERPEDLPRRSRMECAIAFLLDQGVLSQAGIVMSSDSEAELTQLDAWHREGRGVALATVVETWGSAPRPAGSQLVVAEGGDFVGSVSGGCVESAVVAAALDVIAVGGARRLRFGVSNEDAWAVGLPCGGRIEVLVESIVGEDEVQRLRSILAASGSRRAVVRAVELESYRSLVIDPHGSDGADGELREAARRAVARAESGCVEIGGRPWLLCVYVPAPRLMIVGAVHIAQALVAMARGVGFDVTVVDPRRGFATQARFSDVELDHRQPDVALQARGIDRRTAVVALTHDAKLDEPALSAALRSEAFYVGALGSRRSHAARLSRLAKRGFGEESLARIHGPVGLDIGARGPGEIAVSILAQMIAALRERNL